MKYSVTGMGCAACQARVEKAVSAVPGVSSCAVSLLTNSMTVEGNVDSDAVIQAVTDAGYGAKIYDDSDSASGDNSAADRLEPDIKHLKHRLIWSVLFLVCLMYITMGHHMLGLPLPSFLHEKYAALGLIQMVIALVVMCINRAFFIGGFRSVFHLAPNMDTLVALGSSVSFLWSSYILIRIVMFSGVNMSLDISRLYHEGLYFESAAMIPALITVGKLLEAISKGRTTNALRSLMKLRPRTAVLIRDGAEVVVGIEEVKIGDVFAVKAGQIIPVDGIVVDGSGAVNESVLTGESIPVDKKSGDTVSAATVNMSGYLRCETTRIGKDTTLSQIIRMVSDAASTKAPIARIADKVSGVFVPVVIAIALVVFLGWMIAGVEADHALEHAICVLVISCPCALGLATPVAIMVGNGIGARNGILFKTGEALEMMGRVDTVILDKTGTITSGEPEVTDVICTSGIEEKEMLLYAASMEKLSDHPLAKAIVRYVISSDGSDEAPGSVTEPYDVTGFKEIAGNGLCGVINGKNIRVGGTSFILDDGQNANDGGDEVKALSEKLSNEGKTPVYIEIDGIVSGIIAIADTIRDDSVSAIKRIRSLGIRVKMLTGDNERTAKAIGDMVGVDDVIAGVLPDGKADVVKAETGTVVMVGDGINDAPALTIADVGVAIGAGTDVAIDSADVVLMNSSISDVAKAIVLSRKTLRNIHQNLFWAFFYNVICIPMAAGLFGFSMSPMIGAAAMSLSSFTVCMNALRLNLVKLTK